jgi:DNA-binding MarR family transcriptional regulator
VASNASLSASRHRYYIVVRYNDFKVIDMRARVSSGSVKMMKRGKDVDYKALAEFRFALRRFLAFSETAAREAGMSPQQHQALLSIKGSLSSQLSVQELSERLLIQHNSAVELVDRLVQAQLAIRSVDPDDRRRLKIRLTPKAERVLRKLSAVHLGELQAIRPALLELLLQLDQPREPHWKK